MRNYGDGGAYDPEWIGMNARMSEFNAALGLTGLARSGRSRPPPQRRSRACTTNSSRTCPACASRRSIIRDVNTFKDYSIHVTPTKFGMNRDELAAGLLAENIETKKYFYPPMHMQTLYKQFHKAGGRDLKVTEEVTGGILSLPIYETPARFHHRNRVARHSPSAQSRG